MGLAAFLLSHPLTTLAAVVLLSRLGVPIPAEPFLLASGALAADGTVSFAAAALAAALASAVSDVLWYEAGRRRGSRILKMLCRISLEPDSCVRRAGDLFERHGVGALLSARFVPGVGLLAAPMAGSTGMARGRFLAYSGIATVAWVSAFEVLGYAFSSRLTLAIEWLSRAAGSLSAALGGLFVLYLGAKALDRYRFLRSLRVARITPKELLARIEAKEPVVVVDLRHASELALSPETIPGALRMSPQELDLRHDLIPRDRDVVLVCT
jgi:membrane protein DedA with SNARE-associated domain